MKALRAGTRVLDGWLDEWIGSFELFPRAGYVGSKLLDGDGTLQEAGGLHWSDGLAWNYGRGGHPSDPRDCFARQVDWVSGASIAVPKALWDEVGGFDPLFRPAYCEDVDLAFRIRDLGHEVWYQPLAVDCQRPAVGCFDRWQARTRVAAPGRQRGAGVSRPWRRS